MIHAAVNRVRSRSPSDCRGRRECGFRHRGRSGAAGAQAFTLRATGKACAAQRDPREQHVGDSDRRDRRWPDTADRIVGTHWWNPPHLVPLVEVVQAAGTSEATVATTMQLLLSLGKRPAHVRKDVPGFIANRLQHALWREAIAMVADGVCDAQTLDDCAQEQLRPAALGARTAGERRPRGHPNSTLAIHRTVLPDIDHRARPLPIEALVANGKTASSRARPLEMERGRAAELRRNVSRASQAGPMNIRRLTCRDQVTSH